MFRIFPTLLHNAIINNNKITNVYFWRYILNVFAPAGSSRNVKYFYIRDSDPIGTPFYSLENHREFDFNFHQQSLTCIKDPLHNLFCFASVRLLNYVFRARGRGVRIQVSEERKRTSPSMLWFTFY